MGERATPSAQRSRKQDPNTNAALTGFPNLSSEDAAALLLSSMDPHGQFPNIFAADAALSAAVHRDQDRPRLDSNGDPIPSLSTKKRRSAHHGTPEWEQARKDSHKEVERRRREAINEGINQLSILVPGNEKSKGHVLMRACKYIHELKDAEARNVEKWTLEKMLADQAIQELTVENERLREEVLKLKNKVQELESSAPSAKKKKV